MFSALLCVAGGSTTELNKNILAGLCATLSPNVYDRGPASHFRIRPPRCVGGPVCSPGTPPRAGSGPRAVIHP